MQIVKRTLLFGALAKELWLMQSTNVLVENVFVVCVTGQRTMHCVIQAEEFLCVLVKSLHAVPEFFPPTH